MSKLFTTGHIGNMKLKNRIVLSPMGTFYAEPDGRFTSQAIDYYEERAKGGVGLIITEAMFLNKKLASGTLEAYLDSDHVIPMLADLAEAVHQYGTKICGQLSAGVGRNAFPDMDGNPPYSASAIPATFDANIICHALTKEEIKEIMNEYTSASLRLKKAGFDAIEIHAHAGYLVDQFMSPIWNKRTDEYGGSVENRMRFPLEIIAAIRKAVGDDFPILFRIACDHRFEGGRKIEESIQILKILEKAGIDALDIDAGSYETIDYIFPPAYLGDACMAYVTEEARKAVSIPLLNSGNHTPETAEAYLNKGDVDFIMFGRQLIADPEMPNKLKEGRAEDIRPCIRCNEDCIGRIITLMKGASCSVNTQACHEKRYTLDPVSKPKNIIVVGGGPAGLEAARVAALRGHKVILFEKNSMLGGQLAAAATPNFKNQLKKLIKWFEKQLSDLGVTIHFNTEVTVDSECLKSADHILLATGAVSITPPIPGIDLENVIDVFDAHLSPEKVKGDHIVITGGGLSGCDCALELAESGKKVTIVEMQDQLGKDLLMLNAVSLNRMMDDYGICQKTSHKVISFKPEGVEVQLASGETTVITADTMITAFGTKPLTSHFDALFEAYGDKIRIMGDCDQIGKVGNAIRAGFFAGRTIQ